MIRDEMRAHLTEKILPFWERLRDPEHGGFYGYVDKELKVYPEADRGCILHSRILWTFATAARMLGTEGLREDAEWAREAMDRFFDRENGGVYWSVTFDGKPADTTKHTYCQAFAIYGLAAYYRLTGEPEALRRAMALYEVIEGKCRDAGGYREASRADFSPESNEKLSENGVMATRTMNTLIHVIEAYAELYRAGGDQRVRQSGEEALTLLREKFYNPEKRRLEVFCDAEYRPLLDMTSYGHDMESGWLLRDAARLMLSPEKQGPFEEMCRNLVACVREKAFTDHGLKNECVNGEVNELRIWWVQAETMLGLAEGWKMTGDESYLRDLKTQWAAIRRMIVDPRPEGEWLWSVEEDGTWTDRPMVEEWKCPYHNGRMCLRLMEMDPPV